MTGSGKVLSTTIAVLVATGAGVAHAQDGGWRSFVSVSPVFEDADLDAGGDFDVSGVLLRIGTTRDLGGGNRIGVTFNYDYFDYSFNQPAAFNGVAPWGEEQRYGLSVPMSFAIGDGWSVGVSPSVDWFKEDGANSSDSMVWGATITTVKRYANGNVLGLGLGAFDGIEETSVFPFPIIDWRFGERWRLRNPLAAGPTGGAGLELDYLLDSGWAVGVGAAWRKARFRLAESGPVSNGVGEVSGAPVVLRASREFAQTFTLNLYAGVIANGRLRVEDSVGNLLREDDFDMSPIIGANLTARF